MKDRPFDGVIFDFNGVLLWDNALHEEAWRRYSARLRGRAMSDEEMRHHVHGRVNRDIFTYLLGRPLSDGELSPLAEEKEVIYRELARAAPEYRLSPGAVELLDYLAIRGIPRAIATSSPAVNVDFYVDTLELGRWFDPSHIIYDRGLYPGKPAPDIYLEAAERLALPPARCVVVEDSLAGIRSAHDAGSGAIVAIGPPAEHGALRALPGVSAVIADLGGFPRELLRVAPAIAESRP